MIRGPRPPAAKTRVRVLLTELYRRRVCRDTRIYRGSQVCSGSNLSGSSHLISPQDKPPFIPSIFQLPQTPFSGHAPFYRLPPRISVIPVWQSKLTPAARQSPPHQPIRRLGFSGRRNNTLILDKFPYSKPSRFAGRASRRENARSRLAYRTVPAPGLPRYANLSRKPSLFRLQFVWQLPFNLPTRQTSVHTLHFPARANPFFWPRPILSPTTADIRDSGVAKQVDARRETITSTSADSPAGVFWQTK